LASKDRTRQSIDLLEEGFRYASSRERVLLNLVWIVPGVFFLLILVKVLLVARLDLATALAIIRASDPLALLPGILLSMLPTLGAGLNFLGGYIYLLHQNGNYLQYERYQHWTFYGLIVLFLARIQEWHITLMQIVTPLMFALGGFIGDRIPAKKQKSVNRDNKDNSRTVPNDIILANHVKDIENIEREIEKQSQGAVDLAVVSELRNKRNKLVQQYNERVEAIQTSWKAPIDWVIFLFLVCYMLQQLNNFFTTDVWLPAERITVSNKVVISGYVISSDDNWTTILTLGRSVRTIKTGEITSRQICREPDKTQKPRSATTIFGISKNSPQYPVCTN